MIFNRQKHQTDRSPMNENALIEDMITNGYDKQGSYKAIPSIIDNISSIKKIETKEWFAQIKK